MSIWSTPSGNLGSISSTFVTQFGIHSILKEVFAYRGPFPNSLVNVFSPVHDILSGAFSHTCDIISYTPPSAVWKSYQLTSLCLNLGWQCRSNRHRPTRNSSHLSRRCLRVNSSLLLGERERDGAGGWSWGEPTYSWHVMFRKAHLANSSLRPWESEDYRACEDGKG